MGQITESISIVNVLGHSIHFAIKISLETDRLFSYNEEKMSTSAVVYAVSSSVVRL